MVAAGPRFASSPIGSGNSIGISGSISYGNRLIDSDLISFQGWTFQPSNETLSVGISSTQAEISGEVSENFGFLLFSFDFYKSLVKV